MTVEPYSRAQRVFVIVDNGSAHRGKASIKRQSAYKNLILVHTPVHASWLNQAEIYFSIVQRKVLTPNDFSDLDTLEQQLLAFGRRYEQIAAPFPMEVHPPRPRTRRPPTRPTRRPSRLTTNTSANFRAGALRRTHAEASGLEAQAATRIGRRLPVCEKAAFKHSQSADGSKRPAGRAKRIVIRCRRGRLVFLSSRAVGLAVDAQPYGSSGPIVFSTGASEQLGAVER